MLSVLLVLFLSWKQWTLDFCLRIKSWFQRRCSAFSLVTGSRNCQFSNCKFAYKTLLKVCLNPNVWHIKQEEVNEKSRSIYFLQPTWMARWMVDLLQVPLEDTQHKFKIVGMNSDADVWPRICRPASYQNNTSFFSNFLIREGLGASLDEWRTWSMFSESGLAGGSTGEERGWKPADLL